MPGAPLDDPAYEPLYRPEAGRPPAVVARWGPASQLRWFRRFWPEMGPLPEDVLKDFYCHSEEHRGACCSSCLSDEWDGYLTYDDHCCCNGYWESRC
jgi:hypothetical protein